MTDHYQLKSDSEKMWLEAQRIIDHAEKLYESGQIDTASWYELLAKAEKIQLEAKEMEKIAAVETAEFWRRKYLEEYHKQKDYECDMAQQSELRGM